MRLLFKKPAVAAFMSLLLPGLGQAAAGKVRRGLIVAIPAIGLFCALVLMLVFARKQLFDGLVYNSGLLANFLILDVLALVYHVWAVFDAYLGQAAPKMQQPIGTRGITVDRPPLGTTVPVLFMALVITLGLHAYLGALEYRAQNPSCVTAAGSSCDAQQLAAATPTGSPVSSSGGSAHPTASPTPVTPAEIAPSPPPQQAPSWVAIGDKVKVHTGPGTSFPTITLLAKGSVIGGWTVIGAPYTYNGVTRTDWIEIDAKPVSSRFVAMAYFESTDAPPGSVVTPTPFVSPSPSGPAAP